MSIVSEIQNKTQKSGLYKKISLTVFFVILVILSIYYYFGFESESPVQVVVEKPYTVKSGDIRISIEWEGKVLADDTLDLNFKISDKISKIYKRPGDLVTKGEKIAELDNEILLINVQKAELALEQAKANLQWKKESISPVEQNLYEEQVNSAKVGYEISKTQSEIDISNVKIALQNAELNLEIIQKELWLSTWNSNLELLRKQEEQNLLSKQEKAMTQIGQTISFLDTVLHDIDTIRGISESNKSQNDNFEIYLSAKNTSLKNQVETNRYNVNNDYQAFINTRKEYRKNSNYEKISEYLTQIVEITRKTNEMTQTALDSMKSSVSSSNFTESTIAWYVTQIENTITKAKSSVHDLLSSDQDIQTALKSLETKVWATSNDLDNKLKIAQNEYEKTKIQYENAIKKAESTIQSNQKQIDIADANLQIKKQTITPQEQKIYNLTISQAQTNLQEAKKKLSDSILIAPESGTIISINGYEWEILNTNNALPFVQLSIDGNQYIESQVEESEIVKLFIWQEVQISLEAIEWVYRTGQIFFIANAGLTDTNGITSYKVLIRYENQDIRIKNWMWVSIQYITKSVDNVLIVPVKAVKPYNGKPSVKMQNGEYKNITPWFTDNKMVEIISGLRKWDVIMVSE